MSLLGRIARLEALVARPRGATPPPPGIGSELVNAVEVTAATPSPLLLYSIDPGDVVNRVTLRVTVAFSAGTRIQIGTAATPDLYLDADATVEAQYENRFIDEHLVHEQLLLRIIGSPTIGSAIALFKVKDP